MVQRRPDAARFQDLLLRLSHPEMHGDGIDEAARMPPAELEQLLRMAHAQRTLVWVARRLGRITERASQDVRGRIREREILHDDLREEHSRAKKQLGVLGISFVFVKGFTIESRYPCDYVRQIHDLDLVVRRTDDFWTALEALFRAGYEINTLTLRNTSNGWGGVTRVARPRRNGLYPPFRVDVHLSELALRWRSALRFDDAFWERQDAAERCGLPIDMGDAFLIQVAECLDRTTLYARDLLDLIMLGRALGEREIRNVVEGLTVNGLWVEFDRVMAATAAHPTILASLPLIFSRIRVEKRSRLDHRWRLPHPFRVGLGHDVPVALRDGRSATVDLGESWALDAWRFLRSHPFAAWLYPHVAKQAPLPRVQRGTYTDFLFVADRPRGSIFWPEGNRDLLRTPIGMFLAAPNGVVLGSRLAEARRWTERAPTRTPRVSAGDWRDLQRLRRLVLVNCARNDAELSEESGWARLKEATSRVYGAEMAARSILLSAMQESKRCGYAMATETRGWITQAREGYLHTLVAADAMIASCLVKEAMLRARDRGWQLLRGRIIHSNVPALTAIRAHSEWQQTDVVVRKRLDATAELPTGDVLIRTAGTDDLDFVRRLISQAYDSGLSVLERSLCSRVTLEAAADRMLKKLLVGRSVILVAEDRELIGHAIAHLAWRDEITGRVDAMLHDVFVLESERGRGISKLLTQCVEWLAVKAGRRSIVGSVTGGDTDQTRQILSTIAESGWEPVSTTFVSRL